MSRSLHYLGRAVHGFQEDAKLVAPQPCHRIGRLQARTETLRQRHQQTVASSVTHAVVDQFEVVNVYEKDSNWLLVAGQGTRHTLKEERTVG